MNTLANRFGPRTDYASFANRKFLHFQPRKQLVQAGFFQLKKIAVLLLLSAATSAPAFAADQGFYGHVDYGEYMFSNSPNDSIMDGIRIGGGYHFNPYVGVEAGYSIIDVFQGSASGDTCFLGACVQNNLSASSSQIVVVGTMPNGLFVKLGWANTSFDYSYYSNECFLIFCGTAITGSGSATKTNPMFGIGWQSDVNQHTYWRVQYENFGTIKMTATFSDMTSKTYDIGTEVISVGIVHDF